MPARGRPSSERAAPASSASFLNVPFFWLIQRRFAASSLAT
jgi:hypothetical protein